jgi:hypothetical protein
MTKTPLNKSEMPKTPVKQPAGHSCQHASFLNSTPAPSPAKDHTSTLASALKTVVFLLSY